MMKTTASVLALMSLVACGPSGREDNGTGGNGGGNGSGSGSGSGTTETPRQCEKMDIVFVVDNSGSMQEEQSNLGSNFPQFATLLKNYTTPDGSPVDFRIDRCSPCQQVWFDQGEWSALAQAVRR